MSRLGVAAALVDGRLLPGDVDVTGGVLSAVGLAGGSGDAIAVPGFVDLQVNGFAGVDFLSADAAGYQRAGQALLETGVTAYQPTLITAKEPDLVAALQEIAGLAGGGPKVIGAHLEGPFLSSDRLGTHPGEHRQDPDSALLQRLLDEGPVTCVTLAPELPGALRLIDLLVSRGVVAACGHTNATAAEAYAAFDRGARAVTHLYNAMRRPTPRDPGIAGAALCREGIVAGVILDGHHVADETALLAWRAAPGRIALVTDAVAAAGMPDGRYRLGDVEVRLAGGQVRRADGALAGSALTMITAVRNLHALGVPLPQAVEAATLVPANLLGRGDLGRLAPGRAADVVVLDDRLEIVDVVLDGRLCV